MDEASTIDLPDGWRATFEPLSGRLCVRLHPPNPLVGQWGLAERLWDEVHHRRQYDVVLEMNEITFLPSAVMAEIVRLLKRIAVAGGRLRLCGLSEHPHEALRATRLDEIIPLYASREEALQ